jgi:flagellar assembly factor FliW
VIETPTTERATVTVPSQVLGAIEVPAAGVHTMCEPLPGFPGCTGYALLDHVRGDGVVSASVHWLQAVEPPFHAFVVTDPWLAFPDYAPEIADADAAALELRAPEDAQILAIITVPSSGDGITVNLRAPVVLNQGARLGKQVVLLNDEYHTRHVLAG